MACNSDGVIKHFHFHQLHIKGTYKENPIIMFCQIILPVNLYSEVNPMCMCVCLTITLTKESSFTDWNSINKQSVYVLNGAMRHCTINTILYILQVRTLCSECPLSRQLTELRHSKGWRCASIIRCSEGSNTEGVVWNTLGVRYYNVCTVKLLLAGLMSLTSYWSIDYYRTWGEIASLFWDMRINTHC